MPLFKTLLDLTELALNKKWAEAAAKKADSIELKQIGVILFIYSVIQSELGEALFPLESKKPLTESLVAIKLSLPTAQALEVDPAKLDNICKRVLYFLQDLPFEEKILSELHPEYFQQSFFENIVNPVQGQFPQDFPQVTPNIWNGKTFYGFIKKIAQEASAVLSKDLALQNTAAPANTTLSSLGLGGVGDLIKKTFDLPRDGTRQECLTAASAALDIEFKMDTVDPFQQVMTLLANKANRFPLGQNLAADFTMQATLAGEDDLDNKELQAFKELYEGCGIALKNYFKIRLPNHDKLQLEHMAYQGIRLNDICLAATAHNAKKFLTLLIVEIEKIAKQTLKDHKGNYFNYSVAGVESRDQPKLTYNEYLQEREKILQRLRDIIHVFISAGYPQADVLFDEELYKYELYQDGAQQQIVSADAGKQYKQKIDQDKILLGIGLNSVRSDEKASMNAAKELIKGNYLSLEGLTQQFKAILDPRYKADEGYLKENWLIFCLASLASPAMFKPGDSVTSSSAQREALELLTCLALRCAYELYKAKSSQQDFLVFKNLMSLAAYYNLNALAQEIYQGGQTITLNQFPDIYPPKLAAELLKKCLPQCNDMLSKDYLYPASFLYLINDQFFKLADGWNGLGCLGAALSKNLRISACEAGEMDHCLAFGNYVLEQVNGLWSEASGRPAIQASADAAFFTSASGSPDFDLEKTKQDFAREIKDARFSESYADQLQKSEFGHR